MALSELGWLEILLYHKNEKVKRKFYLSIMLLQRSTAPAEPVSKNAVERGEGTCESVIWKPTLLVQGWAGLMLNCALKMEI